MLRYGLTAYRGKGMAPNMQAVILQPKKVYGYRYIYIDMHTLIDTCVCMCVFTYIYTRTHSIDIYY